MMDTLNRQAETSRDITVPLTLDRLAADSEALEIPCSFASNAIVSDPWLGPVQLEISESAVDLTEAMARGIPVLEMHERSLPIGRVHRIQMDGARLVGTIRFSRSDRGRRHYMDCVDGILTDTSVGATITAVKETPDYLIATRWAPREVSLVDRGADQTVGVNRAQSTQHIPSATADITPIGATRMSDQAPAADNASAAPTTTNRNAENAAAIMELARYAHTRAPELGLDRMGEDFAQCGRSFAEFQSHVWETLRERQKAAPAVAAPEIGISRKEAQSFSIVRASLAYLTGDWKKAGFELECSRAVSDVMGRSPRGFFVPAEVQHEIGRMSIERTQSAGDPTAGGFLVADQYRGDLFVEALRAQSVAMQAGVRSLPGLQGNVTIPKQTGNATFSWIGEGANATDSALTFGAINLSPRTIAGAVPMTRRLLMQSSPAIEQLVRSDLVAGAALALDLAIFEGIGAAGEPLGIKNHPDCNTTAISTDTAPTWAEMVAFETEVATDNALGGRLAYVTTPAIRGALKTTSKDTGSGLFVMSGDEVNGYPVYTSTQLSTSLILFGAWDQVLVGFWGVLDIKPDESTLAASGGLVLRAFQDADVAIRQGKAFCKGT